MNKEELRKKLAEKGISSKVVSLDEQDNTSWGEMFGLRNRNGFWFVEYYERGRTKVIFASDSEDESCAELFKDLVRNFPRLGE